MLGLFYFVGFTELSHVILSSVFVACAVHLSLSVVDLDVGMCLLILQSSGHSFFALFCFDLFCIMLFVIVHHSSPFQVLMLRNIMHFVNFDKLKYSIFFFCTTTKNSNLSLRYIKYISEKHY